MAVATTPDWLSRFKDALGVLTAATAITYIAGGATLVSRMYFYKLPTREVMTSQLPQQTLLTVGLLEVIAPSLAVSALYVLYRLLRGEGARPFFSGWNRGGDERLRAALLATAIGIAVSASLAAFWILVRRGGCQAPCPSVLTASPPLLERLAPEFLFWLLALLASIVAALFAMVTSASLAARYAGNAWSSVTPTAIMALVVALWSIPSVVTLQATLSFANSRVCASAASIPYSQDGWLIAETKDMVFIGEAGQSRRLLSLPAGQIQQVFTGDRAWKTDYHCRPTQHDADQAPRTPPGSPPP